MAYIYSRCSGIAAEHLLSRRGTDNPDCFTDALQIITHLAGIFKDHDKLNTYRAKYKNLKIASNESFSIFYSRFILYAGPLRKDQDTLMTDLRDSLVPRLQNILVGCPLDFTTVYEIQVYLQRTNN